MRSHYVNPVSLLPLLGLASLCWHAFYSPSTAALHFGLTAVVSGALGALWLSTTGSLERRLWHMVSPLSLGAGCWLLCLSVLGQTGPAAGAMGVSAMLLGLASLPPISDI